MVLQYTEKSGERMVAQYSGDTVSGPVFGVLTVYIYIYIKALASARGSKKRRRKKKPNREKSERSCQCLYICF